MSKATSKKQGIGFRAALTLLFISLKLIGHIDWSWWWVTFPMWCFFALYIAFQLLIWFMDLIAHVTETAEERQSLNDELEKLTDHYEKGNKKVKSRWKARLDEVRKQQQKNN